MNPTKTGSEIGCSGMESSSCSISNTRHATLVTKPVISHKLRKRPGCAYDKWSISWSFVTHIFHNGKPSHDGNRKTFEVTTSTYQLNQEEPLVQ